MTCASSAKGVAGRHDRRSVLLKPELDPSRHSEITRPMAQPGARSSGQRDDPGDVVLNLKAKIQRVRVVTGDCRGTVEICGEAERGRDVTRHPPSIRRNCLRRY